MTTSARQSSTGFAFRNREHQAGRLMFAWNDVRLVARYTLGVSSSPAAAVALLTNARRTRRRAVYCAPALADEPPASGATTDKPTSASLRHTLGAGCLVTALAAVVSLVSPGEHAASLVALVFGGASYWLVLRHAPTTVHAHGLALGGVLSAEPLSARRIGHASARALGWCLVACALTFPAFWLGYRIWFGVSTPFVGAPPSGFADLALGHLIVIALPEEMFYRGVLQSRLDQYHPPRRELFGAKIGLGLLLSSAIFAVGHLLTTGQPSRLAVFFPSLLFGWLRARTGGIGAGTLFHAACNVFSSYLAHGYGLAG